MTAARPTELPLFDRGTGWHGWTPADDGLMGGVSRSGLEPLADGTAAFAGAVSLENHGGFASCRSPTFALTLPAPLGLRIHALADGRIYTACLHCRGLQPGTSYRCRFQPPAGEWHATDLPLADFVLMRFGQRVGVSPVVPGRIEAVSLMVADRQEGPFRLVVGSVAVYAAG